MEIRLHIVGLMSCINGEDLIGGSGGCNWRRTYHVSCREVEVMGGESWRIRASRPSGGAEVEAATVAEALADREGVGVWPHSSCRHVPRVLVNCILPTCSIKHPIA